MIKAHYLAATIYLCALTLLLVTACASQPLAASPKTAQTMSTSKSDPFVGDLDRKRFADWEKAHAIYIHDLELAALEKDKGHNKTSKEKIIDARLYVGYAEAEQIELGHIKQAREDLQKSRDFLSQASLQVDADNRVKIQSLAKEVKLSAILPDGACREPSFSQARYRYQHLKQNFDDLISEL
jgi:hypothetical protein